VTAGREHFEISTLEDTLSPKRCKLGPRLIFVISNKKSQTRFRLESNQWPWTTLNGRRPSNTSLIATELRTWRSPIGDVVTALDVSSVWH